MLPTVHLQSFQLWVSMFRRESPPSKRLYLRSRFSLYFSFMLSLSLQSVDLPRHVNEETLSKVCLLKVMITVA